MKLLTNEIEKQLPKLYATESTKDKLLVIKLFCTWSNWTLYVVEYDPSERLFFGLIEGHESEWGYFSLEELESIRGPHGLTIERDLHFVPIPLSKLRLRR